MFMFRKLTEKTWSNLLQLFFKSAGFNLLKYFAWSKSKKWDHPPVDDLWMVELVWVFSAVLKQNKWFIAHRNRSQNSSNTHDINWIIIPPPWVDIVCIFFYTNSSCHMLCFISLSWKTRWEEWKGRQQWNWGMDRTDCPLALLLCLFANKLV